MQLHAVVTPPVPGHSEGRVSVRATGRDPIVFTWTRSDATSSTSALDVRDGGTELHGAEEGRYRVDAVDDDGVRGSLTVVVRPAFPDAIVVAEYKVRRASSQFVRDGAVEARGVGLDPKRRYLWTNGAVTTGPSLQDVPCGTYAVAPLPEHASSPPPLVVHLCAPVVVDVV